MLSISQKLLDDMLNHCKGDYPYEACGLIAGVNCKAIKVYPMKNISDTKETCYKIDPQEQLKVFKEIREQNYELLAIYHSHINTKAYPSIKDISLAFYEEASYIIISLKNREVLDIQSFKIKETNITKEELNIIEGGANDWYKDLS
ncbi:MAG: M67 family metallopeptidase [Candidatus Hydrogenedentota bacterium]